MNYFNKILEEYYVNYGLPIASHGLQVLNILFSSDYHLFSLNTSFKIENQMSE
jgi:hypothetical protein